MHLRIQIIEFKFWKTQELNIIHYNNTRLIFQIRQIKGGVIRQCGGRPLFNASANHVSGTQRNDADQWRNTAHLL